MTVDRHNVAHVGSSLRGFARLGLDLTFLASSPCRDHGKESLALCLPFSESETYTRVLQRIAPDLDMATVSPVMTFSMNGPHFGDRYGIVSELLSSLDRRNVDLLALSCTVASITGVVLRDQKETAIQAIQDCFEVPSVTKRD
jgi:aspartokinase